MACRTVTVVNIKNGKSYGEVYVDDSGMLLWEFLRHNRENLIPFHSRSYYYIPIYLSESNEHPTNCETRLDEVPRILYYNPNSGIMTTLKRLRSNIKRGKIYLKKEESLELKEKTLYLLETYSFSLHKSRYPLVNRVLRTLVSEMEELSEKLSEAEMLVFRREAARIIKQV